MTTYTGVTDVIEALAVREALGKGVAAQAASIAVSVPGRYGPTASGAIAVTKERFDNRTLSRQARSTDLRVLVQNSQLIGLGLDGLRKV